jgi:hypothetical protein
MLRSGTCCHGLEISDWKITFSTFGVSLSARLWPVLLLTRWNRAIATAFHRFPVRAALAFSFAIVLRFVDAAAAFAFAGVLTLAGVLVFFAGLGGLFTASVVGFLGVVLLVGVLSEGILAGNKSCQSRSHKHCLYWFCHVFSVNPLLMGIYLSRLAMTKKSWP